MGSFALDAYAKQVAKEALAALEAHRAELPEPVSWVKLQQGGQGGLWVSHVTVNKGMGRDRDELREQQIELWVEGEFPSSVYELDESPILVQFAAELALPEDDLEIVMELFGDALTRELLLAGQKVRSGLEARGVVVERECVVCCGDEDNTWGWPSSNPDDFVTREELAAWGPGRTRAVAGLFYAEPDTRRWFESHVSS